jgi:hypothetical protein
MIYVIGDSHTQAFDDNFTKIWLTAPTAYQNIKKIPEIDGKLSTYKIDKNNDYLFFVFGEIDVRCHLGFIADNNGRTYEDVINECVNRYIVFLEHYINNGYKVGVWGAIPSGPDNGVQGNGSPSYKTKDERNILTKMFNDKLKKMCEEKNILFKSIFDLIMSDYENYNSYHANDKIHLNAGMFRTHTNDKNCEELVKNLFNDLL